MQKESTPSQPNNPLDTLDLSDEMREALERMQGYLMTTANVSERLGELHNQGKKEELEEAIDDLAYDLMAEGDAEYQQLLAQRKQNPNADISTRVNELAAMYKRIIVNEAGLPDEARFTEIEQSRETVQTLLVEKLGHAPTDAEEAKKALGILQYNDSGQATYRFPTEIFPDSVNEKWGVYLTAVCAHVKASKEMQDTKDEEKVKETDAIRKFAHDAITRDVHAILDFHDVKYWEFADTRALLGTIRDHVFPTMQTPEELQHATELIDHYGNQHLRVAESLSRN